MRLGGVLVLVYLAVGVVVAASNDYFEHLGTLNDIFEMIAAVLIWPAVLLGVNINFSGGEGGGGGGGAGGGG